MHSDPTSFSDGERFAFRRSPGYRISISHLNGDAPRTWLEGAGQAQVVAPDWVLFSRDPIATVNQSPPPLLAQRFDAESLRLLGTPSVVLPELFTPGGTASYTAAPNGVLIAATENHSYSPFAWVNLAGEIEETFDGHATFTAAISPDDRSIAMGGFGLWIHDRGRGAATPLDVVTPGRAITAFPSWSRDGGSLAFVGFFAEPSDLRVWNRATGTVTAVFDGGVRDIRGTAWSRDADAIVFWLGPGGDATATEAWEYSLARRQPRRLFTTTVGRPDECLSCLSISPDGRWLLYWTHVDGVADVYMRRYPEIGPPIKVSPRGGFFPFWSGDSRTVYYVSPSDSVMAVDVGSTSSPATLGTPRVVVPAGIGSGLYGVTSDSRQFLRRQGRVLFQPLRVIVNWPGRVGPI